MTTDALVRDHGAPEFDTVGPLHHEGQRHTERGTALSVTQQRGDVGGLSRAIDAALGIHKGIKPVRRRPAADAAVGQVERRRLQAEEGEVTRRIGGGEKRGGSAALPTRQAGFEYRLPAAVGLARGEYLVAARNKPQLDA